MESQKISLTVDKNVSVKHAQFTDHSPKKKFISNCSPVAVCSTKQINNKAVCSTELTLEVLLAQLVLADYALHVCHALVIAWSEGTSCIGTLGSITSQNCSLQPLHTNEHSAFLEHLCAWKYAVRTQNQTRKSTVFNTTAVSFSDKRLHCTFQLECSLYYCKSAKTLLSDALHQHEWPNDTNYWQGI